MHELEEIPTEVIAACKNRGMIENEILNVHPKRLFREFCEWHGLIGWGGTLWDISLQLSVLNEPSGALRE